jgi:hypothetical protein
MIHELKKQQKGQIDCYDSLQINRLKLRDFAQSVEIDTVSLVYTIRHIT